MAIVDRASNISTTHKCELALSAGLLIVAAVAHRRLGRCGVIALGACSARLLTHTWDTWSWWEGRASVKDSLGIDFNKRNHWNDSFQQILVGMKAGDPDKSSALGVLDRLDGNASIIHRRNEDNKYTALEFTYNYTGKFLWISYTNNDAVTRSHAKTIDLVRGLVKSRGWTGLFVPPSELASVKPVWADAEKKTRQILVVRDNRSKSVFAPSAARSDFLNRCRGGSSDFRKAVGQLIDFIVETNWRGVRSETGIYNFSFDGDQIVLPDVREVDGPMIRIGKRPERTAGLQAIFELMPKEFGEQYLSRVPERDREKARQWLRESA